VRLSNRQKSPSRAVAGSGEKKTETNTQDKNANRIPFPATARNHRAIGKSARATAARRRTYAVRATTVYPGATGATASIAKGNAKTSAWSTRNARSSNRLPARPPERSDSSRLFTRSSFARGVVNEQRALTTCFSALRWNVPNPEGALAYGNAVTCYCIRALSALGADRQPRRPSKTCFPAIHLPTPRPPRTANHSLLAPRTFSTSHSRTSKTKRQLHRPLPASCPRAPFLP
jgi:hypothetical protein